MNHLTDRYPLSLSEPAGIPGNRVTMIPARQKRIPDLTEIRTIRVAAYCRVSTDEDNQQNSYGTQISYYTDYITANPSWQLVGIYADEGISGTRAKNRTQFQKMIRAARQNRIDMILCKSISRFARNTVDCLDYVRELRALGVTVIFEKENINTSSMSSEFAISLYASFAQAESESISKNITWGIEKSFREGHVRYQLHHMLGYRPDKNGKPYIIKEEAEIVRRIFQRFAEGFSMSEIARELTDLGAQRRSGRSDWNRHHVKQILQNEKYGGDAILQKTYTVNCLTHDRAKNTGQKPMYFVENCHEAIVDRKTFDTVRLELEKRRRVARKGKLPQNNSHTRYCLSRLLLCPHCGGFYKRTTWILQGQPRGVWRCRNRMEGNPCPDSCSYHESDLHAAILSAVNGMIGHTDAIEKLSLSSSGHADTSLRLLEDNIHSLLTRLTEIETARDRLLSDISGSMFERMSEQLRLLNCQESELADQLESLKLQKEELNRQLLREQASRQLLQHLSPLPVFDDNLLAQILSKVEALSKTEIALTFCGGYRIIQPLFSSPPATPPSP